MSTMSDLSISEEARFEKHLIEEVKKYRLLYDGQHVDNTRRDERTKAWEQIRFGLEAYSIYKLTDECKIKWHKIKYQRKEVVENYGPGSDEGKKYGTDITWLDEFLAQTNKRIKPIKRTPGKKLKPTLNIPSTSKQTEVPSTSKQMFEQDQSHPYSIKISSPPQPPLTIKLEKLTETAENPLTPNPRPSRVKFDHFPQRIIFKYRQDLDAETISKDQQLLFAHLDEELQKAIVKNLNVEILDFKISSDSLEIVCKNRLTCRVINDAFISYENKDKSSVLIREMRRDAMEVEIYCNHSTSVNYSEIIKKFEIFNNGLPVSSWNILEHTFVGKTRLLLTISMNEESLRSLLNLARPNHLNFGAEGTVKLRILPITETNIEPTIKTEPEYIEVEPDSPDIQLQVPKTPCEELE